MAGKKSVENISTELLKVHPLIENKYAVGNLVAMQFTMKSYGQKQPITVVKRKNVNYIVDGVVRYLVSGDAGITELECTVINITDEEVLDYRMKVNQCIKRSLIETASLVEHFFGLVGTSQGKKRDLLGFKDLLSEEEFGEVGKDKFLLACAVLGLDLKPANLRKLMFVYLNENNNPKATGVLEKLNEGVISIHKAWDLLKTKEDKVNNQERRQLEMKECSSNEVWYQLYNQSSMDMSEVEDESVRLCIDSHPYLWLRKYKNQDDLCHGWEKTVEQYVENFVLFCQEKKRKLVKGGVMVTVLGETYRNGYKGVCSKVELALEKDGWIILDVNIWAKNNSKYAPHPNRFINSYERIIVACKPGAEPYYQDVMKKSSTEDYQIKKTKSGGFYMASPESCITNVIQTATYNQSEREAVDKDFQHDAPCREDIYTPFIQAYSSVGDTILDGFVGTGTVGVGLSMGRNVIGFDVDHESIEFSEKRFEKILSERTSGVENVLQNAA